MYQDNIETIIREMLDKAKQEMRTPAEIVLTKSDYDCIFNDLLYTSGDKYIVSGDMVFPIKDVGLKSYLGYPVSIGLKTYIKLQPSLPQELSNSKRE